MKPNLAFSGLSFAEYIMLGFLGLKRDFHLLPISFHG
jgi:hypothetical protein